MKSIRSALLLGFYDWLIPTAIAFILFPVRKSNYLLFESIMAVSIVFAAVFYAYNYFRKVDLNQFREGIKIGMLWLIINLIFDLTFILSKSPWQMPLDLYVSQIGVKYFSIPIITTGFGYMKKYKI